VIAARSHTALFVCKSKPFREGLQKLVGGKARNLFVNPYFLVPARVGENNLDVVLVDEAHRLEKTNIHRYMRPEHRSGLPQVDQIIRAAKTSVFFIDDRQSVRFQEIGSSSYVREAAGRADAEIEEVELLSRFRCMGSNDYLLWIDSLLGYSRETRLLKKNDIFDFRIFNSPGELYDALREKEAGKQGSARLTAGLLARALKGFCWPWNDPAPGGIQIKDVKNGDIEMPWETKGNHV